MRLHAAIGYVTPDDEHHGRGPQIRRADQAESSDQAMIRLPDTDRAELPLGKRGALRGSPAGTDAGGTRHG